jgi:hypothetical protein
VLDVSKRVVDIRGIPEAKELLEQLSGKELQNRTRRGTRKGAAVLRAEVRSRAGTGGIPRRFKKTKTKGHRTPVGTSTGPTSPLLNIFESGAGPHAIAPSRGILSNLGTRREAGAKQGAPFFARGAVTHPGMSARPLIGPVWDAKQDEASEATLDGILEGLR